MKRSQKETNNAVVAGKRDLGSQLAVEWWWFKRRDMEKTLLNGLIGATNKLRATNGLLIRRLDL